MDKRFGVKELNILTGSGTPNITSPGNLNINANRVSISTDVSVGSNLSVSGVCTFSGVGIGTTNATSALTVQGDVSVSGVSTFNNNVNISQGSSLDFGSGAGDLHIYRQSGGGNDSIIKYDGSYNFKILSDITTLASSAGSVTWGVFGNNGVELYYGNSKKFETLGTGVTVTGTTFTDQLSVSGVSTLSTTNISGDLTFTGNNDLYLKDNGVINFGDSNDLQIFHNGSLSVIRDSGSGGLLIDSDNEIKLAKNGTGNDNLAIFTPDGPVELYYDNSKKFETLGAGVTVTGTTFTNQLSVSGVSTLSSDVSVGSTISVDGAVKLAGINTTLIGTGGTTGDIKMILGAPFFHDGTAWREFYLKEGIPVTQSADTEWDNVIYRNDFNTGFTDQKFGLTPSLTNEVDIVASPRKYGSNALRIRDGYLGYAHSESMDFTGDWTIEGWVYWDTLPTNTGDSSDCIISKSDSSNLNGWWALTMQPSFTGFMEYRWYDYETHVANYNGVGIGSYTNESQLKTWNHFALVRNASDGSIHFYLNGVESEFTSDNQVIDNNIENNSNLELVFGRDRRLGRLFDGILDDIRISTIARYTEDFTPPTEALPITGTLTGPFEPPYFGQISNLADLYDVSTASPSTGQVLKWNGIEWAPASDLVGVGTTGVGIGLSDLSITTNPVGVNSLSYDNTTGTFTFTPTSFVGYATETYVNNAVAGMATVTYVDNAIVGFITSGASGAGLLNLTGAAAGTYGDFDKSARITVDSNGRITNITQVGITTDGAGIDVVGISTFNDSVSFGSSIFVNGAINLAVNNATIVGTSGSVGDIKMIGGSPFFYDGSAWREFALTSGTPVTTPEDTEWDNVIFRNDFDTSYVDQRFGQTFSNASNASLVTSPVKYGTNALRLQDGRLTYLTRSEYDFTGAWTIEGWVYWDTLPTGTGDSSDCIISHSYLSSTTGAWALTMQPSFVGYMEYRWYDYELHGGSYDGVGIGSYTNESQLKTWNHFALVREPDNGSIHFYLNGVESEFTSDNQVIDNNIENNSLGSLTLGNDRYLSNRLFDGLLDDIRISTVARYTSNFTPPTEALPISGDLSVETFVPNDKYGEIVLGASPSWVGTSGVTVTQQSSGNYRLTFTTSYANSNDYYVLPQPMDQGFACYVGVGRSTTHIDFSINKQSDDSPVDTGSLAVQVTNYS